MTSRFFLILTLLLGIGGLGACNTIGGIGEDISATGDAITGTADETKEEIKE